MSRLPDARTCERGNDLISFLYGEIDERTAQDFEKDFDRHLLNCAECESELSAFKHVRSSVVAWRQESLGGATATSVSVPSAVDRTYDPVMPSAVAAIRQFFELSPLWLKGSIAFASVLFCALSVLALALLFEKPEPATAAVEKGYTETEMQARIQEAVKSSRQDREAQKATTPPTAANNSRPEKVLRRSTRQSSERVATRPKVRRGPLTRLERDQLAADLRLTIPQDDTDLELLGDGNNQ